MEERPKGRGLTGDWTAAGVEEERALVRIERPGRGEGGPREGREAPLCAGLRSTPRSISFCLSSTLKPVSIEEALGRRGRRWAELGREMDELTRGGVGDGRLPSSASLPPFLGVLGARLTHRSLLLASSAGVSFAFPGLLTGFPSPRSTRASACSHHGSYSISMRRMCSATLESAAVDGRMERDGEGLAPGSGDAGGEIAVRMRCWY